MPAWSWTALLAGAVLASSRSEQRGKQIYLRGTSPSGREITASLGDPAGNALGVAMPKYAMSAQDAADLVAYLKRIGKEREPGLTNRAIRIGAIVPGEGPLEDAGREIQALLEAYFE